MLKASTTLRRSRKTQTPFFHWQIKPFPMPINEFFFFFRINVNIPKKSTEKLIKGGKNRFRGTIDKNYLTSG